MLDRAAVATVDLDQLAGRLRRWTEQVPDQRALALQRVLAEHHAQPDPGWCRARLGLLLGRLGPVWVPDPDGAWAALLHQRELARPDPPASLGRGRPGRGTTPGPPRGRRPSPPPPEGGAAHA